ncbi:MAG: hypothetical protein KJ063_06010 [Anaerolineae bacterium]|nr:hypothetical protein [Anaerolineae bacterium]
MQTNKAIAIVLAALGVLLLGLLLLAGVLLVRDARVTPTELVADNGTQTATAPTPTAVIIPTEAASVTLPAPVINVLPTDTVPPATDTPIPTATPLSTDTPIPEPTATPLPPAAPTNTLRPFVPTNTPVPATPTSPPPPPPPVGVAGLIASHFALQPRSVFAVGQQIWFEFSVSNSTGVLVEFGALGVMPRKNGADRVDMVQVSWGGNPGDGVPPGGLNNHEDNIRLNEAGNYTLRLAVCFESFNACKSGGGTWHTLSQEIAVTIN